MSSGKQCRVKLNSSRVSKAEYAAELFGVGGRPTKKEKAEVLKKLKAVKK